MPCGRKRPTYTSKAQAKRHGSITYGKGKYQTYKVKGGYKARPKK